MSSLHQDRLLAEGSEPATGSASTLASARGTSQRPAESKATSTVSPQRQGKAQRSGTSPTTTDGAARPTRTRRTAAAKAVATGAAGTLASRARAATNATAKVASAKAAPVAKATAKAATAKAATAKAAAAKVASRTAKAGVAKPAPAATPVVAKAAPVAKPVVVKAAPAVTPAVAKAAPVAKPVVAKAAPAAKPAVAKAAPVAKPVVAKAAPAAKPATAKASPAAKPAVANAAPAAKPATAKTPTAATATGPQHAAPKARPTPFKRTAPIDDAAPVVEPLDAPVDAVVAPAVVATLAAEGRRSRFLRRRPPSIGRRPALYLAAAIVGATSLSAVSVEGPMAQATETASSVSVAEELGIHAAPAEAVADTDATQLLGELAASRSTRDAEQAAAAQGQAEADRVAAAAAAEAARPTVVLPVAGAHLTSVFGARWGTLHAGIDLAAPMQTPEYAAMDGIVLEAGPASGFGLAVYIQHANGDVTVYGHMDSILVKAGQVVRAGDTIALLGNRGQSTGPHLHFEVHVGGINGQKIDPLPWLRERGIAI
jgi:murein DD-endopeptidase MepM/ murein hydrolase activator NlpD